MPDDRKQTKEVIFTDYNDSQFQTFLEFLINLKFDNNYNWRNGLQTKINAVLHLSNEVKSQYYKAMKAKEEMEVKGFGSGLESELLLIKFETLLNSVYSLCDNLAFISYRLHPGIKKMFNDQRKNVAKYRINYPEYSEYIDLIESATWYEKLHTMRSESTHYLPGFVYHSKNGLGILYRDMEHSDERIEIENIQEYIVNLIAEINDYLERYGNYHLKRFIDEGHKIFYPCFIPNPEGKGFLVGGRVITYSEYMKKLPGKCQFRDIPCPRKNICPAYSKNDE
ncbi:MAG: hypothetical protein WC586_06360 [Methanoregula sp.]